VIGVKRLPIAWADLVKHKVPVQEGQHQGTDKTRIANPAG
jgi:hypothetical protein